MSTTRIRRQFSSGSRPAPDPYDKYLEHEGFYRKHTARDASCLFRVISEQMFDTQEYHEQTRKDCIDFMVKNKKEYADKTPIDFDEYICKMSKPKAYGTLLELRAMGFMYKRNILLYKPYDLGVWLIKENSFDGQCFRVFYAPDKHFDSIFTKSFIEKAALCQSICYEILYKNVFKLPDIEYSVEMMLHNSNENDGNNAYALYKNGNDKYASHIVLQDGRKFRLDGPDDTQCILDDYRLCHFHNRDFDLMVNQYSFTNPHVEEIVRFKRLLGASLPAKYISCVRQLLNEGITPFPYKVAKALDPDIYRNIEFDSWNDYRKELRSKYWYSGGWNFQVGVKCLTKLDEKQAELFKCHIQEMSPNNGPCVVFVEDLAEKHSVPYSFLQPLNYAKPFMLPHRYNRDRWSYNTHTYNGLRHEKKYLSNVNNKKYNESESELIEYTKCIDSNYHNAEKIYNLNQYTNLSNFHPYSLDIVAMPLNIARSERFVQNNSNNKSTNRPISQTSSNNDAKHQQNHTPPHDTENNSNLSNLVERQPQHQQQLHQPSLQDQQFDTSPYAPAGQSGFYYFPTAEYADQGYYAIPPELVGSSNLYPVSSSLYTNPNSSAMVNNSLYSPLPPGNWPNYNPPINGGAYYLPSTPNQPLSCAYPVTPLHLCIRRKDLLLSNGQANYSAPPSYAPQGNDLPYHDKFTLRFFYNLGHEFLKYIQNTYGMDQLLGLLDGGNSYAAADVMESDRADAGYNQLTTDFQQLNFYGKDSENGNLNKQKLHSHYHPGNSHGRRNVNPKFRKDKPNLNQHRHPHQIYHSNQLTSPSGAPKKIYRSQGQNSSKMPYNYNQTGRDTDNIDSDNNNTAGNMDDNNNNNVASNNYKNDSNNHGDSYNNSYRATLPRSPNAKNPNSGSQFQSGGVASINRENVCNPSDNPSYNTSYYPYQAQYMPYYSMEGTEHQPFYMPLNVYTQPGLARAPVPPPMASPCDIIPESSEPFIGNYYSQPPSFLYPPPLLPSQLPPQNYYYPPPAVISQPPPKSLNSSNISSASSNINGANTSNQSQ